jgi:hypothetical protein
VIPERFSEQYDPEPEPGPTRDEYDYPPDGVGALPAGVRIRCQPCGKAFRLIRGPLVSCPHCGCSLEARR